MNIETIAVGDTASVRWAITTEQIDGFAELSRDNNPLHMDDPFARERGFGGRVAHGMLALSGISRLIGTQLPGPGSLWIGQEHQFVTPVFAGDNLEARVTVQNVSLAARVVVLSTIVKNVDSESTILRGSAKVRIPPLERPVQNGRPLKLEDSTGR